jgi:outer membrane biosynthesis protein TonB
MRRAIGGGGLLAVLLALWPAQAAFASSSPALTLQGPVSGQTGTAVTYTYAWDYSDCEAAILGTGGTDLDAFNVELAWNDSANTVTAVGASVSMAQGCTATINTSVPGDEPLGPVSPSAIIYDVNNGSDLSGGGATGSPPFVVTPPPTPPPTPTPIPTPLPTPTPTIPPLPTPTPPASPPPSTSPPGGPTASPGSGSTQHPTGSQPSASSTSAAGASSTPAVIVAAVLGSTSAGSVAEVATGAGGDSPEGGAACGGNAGRVPSLDELSHYADQLAAGVVSTTVEAEILGSPDYYNNVGGNDLGFITRLYDDVLQRDPTSAEISTADAVLEGASTTGRQDVASAVILGREARSDRLRRAFERLLGRNPTTADESRYLYSLPSPGSTAITYEGLVEQLTSSDEYYSYAGASAKDFAFGLYQGLLSRHPTPSELSSASGIIAAINSGNSGARLGLAHSITSSGEYHNDEVTGFYRAYFHSTCAQLDVGRCMTVTRDPTQAELNQWLRSFASGSTEEDLIASLLSGNEYYASHGASDTAYVTAVYQDLLGRSPSAHELSSAQSTYANTSKGRRDFAQAMLRSNQYRAVVVRLAYRELLLRDPTPTEMTAGLAQLSSGANSTQTPDGALISTIMATTEYYSDAGPYDYSFVRQAVVDLLKRPDYASEESSYLSPSPHGGPWQQAVALRIMGTNEYRSDYVRGAYERYLGQTTCGATLASAGFIGRIPGGWLGLGVLLLVLGGGVTVLALRRQSLPGLSPVLVRLHMMRALPPRQNPRKQAG